MAASEARRTSHSSNQERSSNKNKKNSKNPYANLGREGFCALLEELEEKKKKILSEVGAEDVSMIRFVHSADNKLKPVVVVAKSNSGRKAKLLSYNNGTTAVSADMTVATEAKQAAAIVVEKEADQPATTAAEQDKQLVAVAPTEQTDEQDKQLGAIVLAEPIEEQDTRLGAVVLAEPIEERDKQLIAAGPAPTLPPTTRAGPSRPPPQTSKTSNKTSKNPYANMGHEKFSALLEELEEKKRQIFSQISPEEAALVRFSYAEDNKLKPIVVTSKRKQDMRLVAAGSASTSGEENGKRSTAAPLAPSAAAPSATAPPPRVLKTSSKNSKNPYANLGLEKFSALLEELEKKKQEIISQSSPDEVPLVRFFHSEDNKLKPIVVTGKGKKDWQLVDSRSAPVEENIRRAPEAPSPSRVSGTSSKNNKNPYAALGREKFSALLEELEEKKKEIISQISPEDMPLVRFSYSGDNLKPIVVSAKGKGRQVVAAGSVSAERNTILRLGAPETPSSAAVSPAAASRASLQMLWTSNQNSKNPYANLGLDKFSVLLEELEEKKQKIMSQIGPEDVSLLRFSYTGDNELKPILVTKGKKERKAEIHSNGNRHVAAIETHRQTEEQMTELEADEETIDQPAPMKEDEADEKPGSTAGKESDEAAVTDAVKGVEGVEDCKFARHSYISEEITVL